MDSGIEINLRFIVSLIYYSKIWHLLAKICVKLDICPWSHCLFFFTMNNANRRVCVLSLICSLNARSQQRFENA